MPEFHNRWIPLGYLYKWVETWILFLPDLDLLQSPWLVTAETCRQLLEPLSLSTIKLLKEITMNRSQCKTFVVNLFPQHWSLGVFEKKLYMTCKDRTIRAEMFALFTLFCTVVLMDLIMKLSSKRRFFRFSWKLSGNTATGVHKYNDPFWPTTN